MNDKQKQMMSEEYGRDFSGCLWGMLACIIAIVGTGIWLFTR